MYQFDISAPGPRSHFAVTAIVLAALALAGCGGGSDSPPAPATVTVSGKVTFDLVPVVAGGGVGGGLDYAATVRAPARDVTVEFVEGTTVLASGPTDDAGDYSLVVPSNRTGFVRVRAEMVATGQPAWDFRVVDNTNASALYVLDGSSFSSGVQDAVRDLHAASGWTGAGYGADRAAAPLAILDTIRDALDLLLAADPAIELPPLVLHWSPDNIPSPASGGVDPASGEIVTTFYSEGFGGIFVLGAENSDTDEYDRYVILHEWAHYLETAIARSDTIGGPHALGDTLDLRVAFSEGWGNAFAAIAAGDSIYRDALGPAQATAPAFDVEGLPLPIANPSPGWFSEQSAHEILYDLVDADVDGADSLTLDFGAVYDVLTGEYRDDVAFGSLFSFIDRLQQGNPAAAPAIEALVTAQSVDPVTDAFGTGETNDAGAQISSDVLPVYRRLTPGAGPVNVCSTDEFVSSSSDLVNKLGTRQFVLVDVPVAGSVDVLITATSVPAGEYADPDLAVHRDGLFATSDGPPTSACMDVGNAAWQAADCREAATLMLAAGEHVLEVYEYSNTQTVSGVPAPIGRTCFDVSVTLP